MDIDKILFDYCNGDENKRISLFLAYRDLREEFSSIEQDLDAVQFPEKGVLKWLRWIVRYP